jgi:subtilisin family serine protease
VRVVVLVVLAFAALPAPAYAQNIIVKRAPGLSPAERADVRKDAGVKLVDTLSLTNTEVVRPNRSTGAALRALNADPDVAYAEVDRSLGALSDDPYFSQQWALQNTGQFGGIAGKDMSVPEAWQTSTGAGVLVAVVDTGVDANALDLAGQLAGNPGEIPDNGIDDDGNGYVDDSQGWDFVADDNDPDDENNHGTHVTGTIAAVADNGIGVAGVAPGAKVMPLRALDADGRGSDSTIAEAFDYAGDMGARVVNASLGGAGASRTLTDAMAAHPDTLYVVAAGNDNMNTDLVAYAPCTSPAPNVICVGASTNRDARASFSNYGLTTVDVFAPGVLIESTWPGGTYKFLQGTSMAAPHVAGEAALALAADPSASTAQLKEDLIVSADPIGALAPISVSGGRADAAAAVADIASIPDPTPTPTATPTATPVPVVTATPTPTPETPQVIAPPVTPITPAVATAAAVRTLKLSGRSLSRSATLRATFTMTRTASVRVSVTRAGHAKKATAAWSLKARSGSNTLRITRRVAGHTLARGRYTLTVAVAGSSRTASFTVR